MEALVGASHEMGQGASAALGLHLGVLLLHLWRCAGLQDAQGRSGQSTVERFTRLIELHYREGLRIGKFAERLGVSHGHLHEACVRIGGVTPLAMLHERILEEARARLRQNEMSLEQVGYSLGFRDPGYFNRFFKRITGQSPGASKEALVREGDRHRPRSPPGRRGGMPDQEREGAVLFPLKQVADWPARRAKNLLK